MEILFEDREITVAIKTTDRVSEQTSRKDGFADLLAARNPSGYIGVVHRLDRGVGGVMVYANTPSAAAKLSSQVQSRSFGKKYLAVVHGTPEASNGRLTDLLFHDRVKNKTYTVERKRNGVKEAILDYECLGTISDAQLGTISLLSITLQTGRTHQIRVQFASRGLPLVGDRKYGAPTSGEIALFCTEITFRHPKSDKPMCFSQKPTGEIWTEFDQ